jgi:hypothetical protein
MLQLRDDQIARVLHYDQQPKCLDLSEPGTGKTPAVVTYQGVRETRTVWVMPKSLMKKNVIEFERWTGQKAVIVDGSPAKVQQAILSGAKVLLMGPTRFGKVWNQLPSDVRACDVDEFHMCFKGPQSARTGAFLESQRRFDQGIYMTGTMVDGRLDSCFSAIQAIDPRYYPFGYDQFLAEHAYCDERGRPFQWHGHDKLRQILQRFGVLFTFKEIFGDQEKVPQLQWVEMNDKQRAIYDEFEEQALLELDDFMVDGTLPGVALIRARQIMEHPNCFPDLRDKKLPPVDIMPGEKPAKLEALEIHLEDHVRTGKPVIVFAALVPQTYEIAELGRRMGMRVGPVINGQTSVAMRDEADRGFQEGRYDMIVATPGTASVGYNWQFCGDREVDHVINMSLGWMDSDYDQGFKRAIRQKRSGPLRITTMAYIDSIDIKLMSILKRKSRDAHKVQPNREVICFSANDNEEDIAA